MRREDAMKRAEKRQDNEKINFVTTYSSYLPNVNQILKRHGHYLQEDRLGRYIGEAPRLSLRRAKNLGDMIVNAKERVRDNGSGPCGEGCVLCGSMLRTDKVKGKDARDCNVRGKMNCRTVGLVYGMWCGKCDKVVYVGKSKNSLRERFYGHRTDLRSGCEDKPAHHFKRQGHNDGDMKVVALEEVSGNDDIYRIERERWWMQKMGTLEEENRRW
jgi:hypothetical protein